MTARKLDSYLSEAASPLHRLMEAARVLDALARIWESVAPVGLARSCRVGRLDDSVLTLYADNGAIASKIKQQLPSLLEKFQKRGGKITGIRIDVQVKSPSSRRGYVQKSAISGEGLASLEKLEADLPDSNLKEALTNLIRHQRESKQQNETADDQGQADNQQ